MPAMLHKETLKETYDLESILQQYEEEAKNIQTTEGLLREILTGGRIDITDICRELQEKTYFYRKSASFCCGRIYGKYQSEIFSGINRTVGENERDLS